MVGLRSFDLTTKEPYILQSCFVRRVLLTSLTLSLLAVHNSPIHKFDSKLHIWHRYALIPLVYELQILYHCTCILN